MLFMASWLTGNFIDNVAFTRTSSKGKTNNAALRFSEVGNPLAPRRPGIRILLKTANTQRGDQPPKEMIGLLERQIQTWKGTEEVWRGQIIQRIRTTLKARIQKERGKGVERTEGYSND